jgi:CBS domain-containing protein
MGFEFTMKETLDLDAKISDFAVGELFTADVDDSVADAAKIMRDNELGSIFVIKGSEVLGIVTERDVLYKVVAEGKDPSGVNLSSIMSSPVQTIEHSSTVRDAITKMSKLRIRRLAVTKDKKIIGMVTQKSVIAGGEGKKIPLPELTKPDVLRCPYCDEQVRDVEELSRHIDFVHVGKGLLEGNLRKW